MRVDPPGIVLAPETILFYLQDWSLYKNLMSSNHKTDANVMEELEKATGMDDACSKRQWVSSRCTTRPEDTAYSLFAIFDLHLSVLYGESAEKALGHLLAEIISQSGAISVLDWSASSTALRKPYRALAKSPLPPFINHHLSPPSINHRVTTIQLQAEDPLIPSYTYKIRASCLRPLKVTLLDKLEDAAMNSSDVLDATTEKQLLSTLGKLFNPPVASITLNEYKRIASSALIIAEPVGSGSILQSKVRTFNIV
ncbi:hypothetical protein EDD16DRAFT_1902698 [Pisolithus croceorrhizus]|nr:hypothetical protein EDD16DRAFT_1902698 [Pisolithus croceorrhizus]KAI6161655.1 hypothetical protein EDD17DRAFT_1758495 [Pisolithus thermaeus]